MYFDLTTITPIYMCGQDIEYILCIIISLVINRVFPLYVGPTTSIEELVVRVVLYSIFISLLYHMDTS